MQCKPSEFYGRYGVTVKNVFLNHWAFFTLCLSEYVDGKDGFYHISESVIIDYVVNQNSIIDITDAVDIESTNVKFKVSLIADMTTSNRFKISRAIKTGKLIAKRENGVRYYTAFLGDIVDYIVNDDVSIDTSHRLVKKMINYARGANNVIRSESNSDSLSPTIFV